MIKTNGTFLKNNFFMNVNGNKFNVSYPKNMPELSDIKKQEIIDVLSYIRISPMASTKNIQFSFDSEIDQNKLKIIDKGTLKNFPLIADKSDGRIKTQNLIRNFNQRDFVFEGDSKEPDMDWNLSERALISMSFGKDSLLCYALLDEIGMDTDLVFINDFGRYDATGYAHRVNTIKSFEEDTGKHVHIIRDDTDGVYEVDGFNDSNADFYSSNALLSYSVTEVPVAFALGTKYFVFGCEQNFNEFYFNPDNYKCYPSYDQTTEYTLMHDKIIKNLTSSSVKVMSPIEPLYNILEFFILNNRYPNLLKYLSSCPGNETSRWCRDCSACSSSFLFMTAVGGRPKTLFKENLFGKKYEKIYPIFGKPPTPYEKPAAIRDEHLFAFYLAFKRGARGYLMDKFKKHLLKEAKSREDELYNKFIKIHDAKTIPNDIHNKLTSIFSEEINKI